MKFLTRAQHLILSIILTLVPVLGFANGREGGVGGPGGGAGLRDKKDGTIKTLGEAGLLPSAQAIFDKVESTIKEFPEFYEVSARQEEAVVALLSKIFVGFNAPELSHVIGHRGTHFRVTSSAESDTLEKIKADYRKVISSNKLELPEELFVVLAYSKKAADSKEVGTTYFLKEFDSLKPDQQSLIFFHEFNMRKFLEIGKSSAEALKKSLRMDAIVWDILKNGHSDKKTLALYDELADTTWADADTLRLWILEKSLGRPIFLGELISDAKNLETRFDWSWNGKVGLNPSLIQQNFGSVMPSLARRWEKRRLEREILSRDEREMTQTTQKKIAEICAREDEILKNLKIRPDFAGEPIHFDEDRREFRILYCGVVPSLGVSVRISRQN